MGDVPLLLLLALLPLILANAGDLLRARVLLSLKGLLLLNSAGTCWGELGTLMVSAEFITVSDVPELLDEVEMLWNGLVDDLLGVVGIVGEDGLDMLRKGLLLASFSTVRLT